MIRTQKAPSLKIPENISNYQQLPTHPSHHLIKKHFTKPTFSFSTQIRIWIPFAFINHHVQLTFSCRQISRYTFDKRSIAMTVSKGALDFSIWHQPCEALQLGGSFIFNKRTSKAVGSFYYQLEMSDTIIKGMIDSDWSIGCTYNR